MDPTEDWCYFHNIAEKKISPETLEFKSASLVSVCDEFGYVVFAAGNEVNLILQEGLMDLLSDIQTSNLVRYTVEEIITHIAISPTGAYLAVAYQNKLKILEVLTLIKKSNNINIKEYTCENPIRHIEWSFGNVLGVLSTSKRLEFLDIHSRRTHTEGVDAFCFLKNNSEFFIEISDQNIKYRSILHLDDIQIQPFFQPVLAVHLAHLHDYEFSLIHSYQNEITFQILEFQYDTVNPLKILCSISDVDFNLMEPFEYLKTCTHELLNGFVHYISEKDTVLFSSSNMNALHVIYKHRGKYVAVCWDENIKYKAKAGWHQDWEHVLRGLGVLNAYKPDSDEDSFNIKDAEFVFKRTPLVLYVSSSGEYKLAKYIDLREGFLDVSTIVQPKDICCISKDIVVDMYSRPQLEERKEQQKSNLLKDESKEPVGFLAPESVNPFPSTLYSASKDERVFESEEKKSDEFTSTSKVLQLPDLKSLNLTSDSSNKVEEDTEKSSIFQTESHFDKSEEVKTIPFDGAMPTPESSLFPSIPKSVSSPVPSKPEESKFPISISKPLSPIHEPKSIETLLEQKEDELTNLGNTTIQTIQNKLQKADAELSYHEIEDLAKSKDKLKKTVSELRAFLITKAQLLDKLLADNSIQKKDVIGFKSVLDKLQLASGEREGNYNDVDPRLVRAVEEIENRVKSLNCFLSDAIEKIIASYQKQKDELRLTSFSKVPAESFKVTRSYIHKILTPPSQSVTTHQARTYLITRLDHITDLIQYLSKRCSNLKKILRPSQQKKFILDDIYNIDTVSTQSEAEILSDFDYTELDILKQNIQKLIKEPIIQSLTKPREREILSRSTTPSTMPSSAKLSKVSYINPITLDTKPISLFQTTLPKSTDNKENLLENIINKNREIQELRIKYEKEIQMIEDYTNSDRFISPNSGNTLVNDEENKQIIQLTPPSSSSTNMSIDQAIPLESIMTQQANFSRQPQVNTVSYVNVQPQTGFGQLIPPSYQPQTGFGGQLASFISQPKPPSQAGFGSTSPTFSSQSKPSTGFNPQPQSGFGQISSQPTQLSSAFNPTPATFSPSSFSNQSSFSVQSSSFGQTQTFNQPNIAKDQLPVNKVLGDRSSGGFVSVISSSPAQQATAQSIQPQGSSTENLNSSQVQSGFSEMGQSTSKGFPTSIGQIGSNSSTSQDFFSPRK